VDEVGAVEAPRIVAASTDASTSAFRLGALLAGALMIIGGIASAVGIRNPRREAGERDGPPTGEDRAAPGQDADDEKNVDFAPHG
jgi:hypothetical protein